MKTIVIGSGGREHAIAFKLASSSLVSDVYCVPGNGGTALESKCHNITLKEGQSYADIAREYGCTLAVVGPEDPLSKGEADLLWQSGISTVGPKKAAAQLEASKDLAKSFMSKYHVASALSKTFTDAKEALSYIEEKGAPIVIKADGLAAGKGVVVALTIEEARAAVKDMMEDGSLGQAGSKLVIEDYLRGSEISVLAAVSVTPELSKQGKSCIKPFLAARDHKRLMDGALGPNTGGMGAICPVEDATEEVMAEFSKTILTPTLNGLVAEGYDYRGFIFFGLMLTKDGPKCLEYNVRLGDPETQAVLPMMDCDFASLCQSIADGSLIDFDLKWKSGYQVAPVAVSGGYPKAYEKGKKITIDTKEVEASGAKIFIAGATEKDSCLYTSGGRVLACSAHGDTFDEAWKKSYLALQSVSFDGMFYRRDIGLPGAAESK